MKEPLPNDVDSGNEADSDQKKMCYLLLSWNQLQRKGSNSEEDDSDCNNSAKNKGKWVLNENIAFDYSLCHEDVFKSVDISSLHVPLPISEMACMHIEDNEEFVFIVPPFKRDQSPIVFGRGQTQTMTSRESDNDLETPQFFHYA